MVLADEQVVVDQAGRGPIAPLPCTRFCFNAHLLPTPGRRPPPVARPPTPARSEDCYRPGLSLLDRESRAEDISWRVEDLDQVLTAGTWKFGAMVLAACADEISDR